MATSLFLGSTTTLSSPSSLSSSVSDLKSASSLPTDQRPTTLVVRASSGTQEKAGRRRALSLAAVLLVGAAFSGNAKAGLVEELLAKSQANKELNERKRLATSGANVARAYTVTFGTCKFPENFTGCQDLAKKTNVPFLTDDLKLECEGKEKHKCGSNVFWKW